MLDSAAPPQDQPDVETATRMYVLEMVVAAMAARLPKADREEIISLLVFVAKGSDAATNIDGVPPEAPVLRAVGEHAANFLERIAASRGAERHPGAFHAEGKIAESTRSN